MVLTSDQRLEAARSLSTVVAAHAKVLLHGAKLKGGGWIKVYTTGYSGIAVEVYRVEGHTQSTLGSIRVKMPIKDCVLADIKVEGTFYDYGRSTRELNRIQMISDTPEEAVNKMAECIAPLIELDVWPPEPRPTSIPLQMADCRP